MKGDDRKIYEEKIL